MSKITNLINKEEDILSSIDETKYLEKEVEIQHEHLHVEEKTKEEIRRRNVALTRKIYVVLATLAAIFFVGVLVYGISFLPTFGADGNPTQNEIIDKYIQDGIDNTGATNFVTGMILDYRAFDTLGESFVLFSAVTCVLVLLQEQVTDDEQIVVIHRDTILRYVASILVPIVFVFGVYVVLNGHLSPGGGFSGGAILGAGLILYALAFGGKKASRFFTAKTFKTICSIALLGYALVKCYSFLMGGMHVLFADSHLWHDPIADFFHSLPVGSVLSGGYILILNICVGAVVACTMYGFYSLFKKGEI